MSKTTQICGNRMVRNSSINHLLATCQVTLVKRSGAVTHWWESKHFLQITIQVNENYANIENSTRENIKCNQKKYQNHNT